MCVNTVKLFSQRGSYQRAQRTPKETRRAEETPKGAVRSSSKICAVMFSSLSWVTGG